MMKFFRKHNRKLLAVFMALLLIVWLGGPALTDLIAPDQMGQTLATSRFGKILYSDQHNAIAKTNRLAELGINWRTLNDPPQMWPAEEPLSILDWILLTREAEEMGLPLQGDELDTAINTVLRAYFPGSPRPLDEIRRRAGRQDVHVDAYRTALADFLAIRQLLFMVTQAAVPSEAEVRTATRDVLEQVTIDAVCLRALSFIDPEQAFTDEQIRQQFEAYKDSTPEPGSLTFGYFQPPRVKVEYVRIHQQTINDTLRMTDEEVDQRARDFWRANRTNEVFKRPLATTQPTTGPATQPVVEYFETYAQAKEAAHQAVRSARAAEITENLTSWLARRFATPFDDAIEGPDRYRIAPQHTRIPDYVTQTLGAVPPDLRYPTAVDVRTTDGFDAEGAARVPDIGTAFFLTLDGQPVHLARLAFFVQGLADYPAEARGDIRELYTSLHQFHPRTLRDLEGNRYLFRVVEVMPAHAPESPDVVRDAIIEDLRRQAAFDAAKAALEDLATKAKADGLAAAWEQAHELQDRIGDPGEGISSFEGFFAGISFSHREWMAPPDADTVNVPSLGRVSRNFVTECFALGEAPGEGPKLAVLEQPDDARVILVQWKRTTPMSERMYGELRRTTSQQIQRMRAFQFQRDWVDPKLIKARNELEYPREERTKKKPDVAPAQPDDTVEM
jgi:hypothetical protein